ncbi:thioredoxin [Corynebacterium confusum]|uniref:thioredoxin n=1 Tax=Corynebacterium confusum TaxID=71254 RepID=UPI0025B5E528|nr:thioredoxin [Corynebacterium confusum]WJY90770.1 Thioredoxin-1 [Corynebacterium confusum]
MSNVKEVTTDNFRSEVIEAGKPVVVDFWADWCGPCKKLSPLLDEIAEELGDKVGVVKVNVEEQRNLAAMFQIMSLPSVLIFNNGEKVEEFAGLRSKEDILSKINNHL